MIGKVLLKAEKQLKIEKCMKRNGGGMKVVCTRLGIVLSSYAVTSKNSTNGVVVT
jgi:hypothetical protein